MRWPSGRNCRPHGCLPPLASEPREHNQDVRQRALPVQPLDLTSPYSSRSHEPSHGGIEEDGIALLVQTVVTSRNGVA